MEATVRSVHPWVAEGAGRVRFGIDARDRTTGALAADARHPGLPQRAAAASGRANAAAAAPGESAARGRKGGLLVKERYGRDYYRAISALAAKSRAAKRTPPAPHDPE